MRNNIPEYFNHITETEYGTCMAIDGLSEYSADGFELIGIHNGEEDYLWPSDDYEYHYLVEEGVRSLNLIRSCYPQSITFPSTLEEIKNVRVLCNCIDVVNNSPYFLLENGCLYTIDKSELVFVFGKLVKNSDIIFDGVQKIRDYALAKCNNYSSITIPSSVKDIGAAAFYCNNNLQAITISHGVEVVRKDTFSCNTELTEINLPDTIFSIEAHAFYNCSSLESITLPKSLRQIDSSAFRCCDNIKSITVNSPHFILENGLLYDSKKSEIIFEFEHMIAREVTIPKTVQWIPFSSLLLDYHKGRRITISQSSHLLKRFNEAYGLFLDIVD